MPPEEVTPLPPHSHAQFNAVVGGFEARLAELLASPAYGRGPGRVPPPLTHGVYLFSEVKDGETKHLYVGRVGITARALASGKGYSNFRARLAGHSRPSSGHNQATFAYRLAVEAVGNTIPNLPATRKARCEFPAFADVYTQQKARVTAMEFRVVAIPDDFESYVFEPYAAYRLGTPYNSWATS